VREDSEWTQGRAAQAVHLGKGILERDIEMMFPDKSQELIMYCGGGYRSALTADVAQRMGYSNVYSLHGGYKALVAAQV
jgi:rhodanese-related sulfurtransferase